MRPDGLLMGGLALRIRVDVQVRGGKDGGKAGADSARSMLARQSLMTLMRLSSLATRSWL